MLAVALSLLASTAPVAVVVADLRDDGVGAAVSQNLGALVAFELARFDGVDVISYKDVRATIDEAAQKQLLGCDDDACLVDAGKLFTSQYLLHGSVAPADGGVSVAIALVDTRAARVVGRARQLVPVVGGNDSEVVAAVRAAVGAVIAPLFGGGDAVNETALGEQLARLTTAQRPKPFDVDVRAGLIVPFTIAATPDIVTPGANATLEGTWCAFSWLGVGARAFGDWVYGAVPGSLVTATPTGVVRSPTSSDAQWVDAGGEGFVRVRPSEGLLLPFVDAGVGASFAQLDLGDEVAAKKEVPTFLQRQREGGAGLALDASAGAGIQFLVVDALAVSMRVDGKAAFSTLHQKEFVGDAPKNASTQLADSPVPPLLFIGISLGVAWQG